MMRCEPFARIPLWLVVLAALFLCLPSCGHLKNVRDDFLDCGSLALGVVPPVVPDGQGEKRAIGFLPPAIGVYVQATDFIHLGALYKATGDLEWDRRGLGIMRDERHKLGVGPLHHVYISQSPISANAYKVPGSRMEGWRRHMRDLSDPITDRPGKVMIFDPAETTVKDIDGEPIITWPSLPWLPLGWHDWEFISVEVAIPEPFILHSGFYFRAGVDPSQFFDLVLSIFGIDLYSDSAYTFGGDLKYPEG